MPRVCVSAWREVDDEPASEVAQRAAVALAVALDRRGVAIHQLGRTSSVNQRAYEQTLLDWHNSMQREVDIAIRCQRRQDSDSVLVGYYGPAQEKLAATLAAAVAGGGGQINGRAQARPDVPFLTGSHQPAFLVELPLEGGGHWRGAAKALANALEPTLNPRVAVSLTVPDDVELKLIINGEELLLPD